MLPPNYLGQRMQDDPATGDQTAQVLLNLAGIAVPEDRMAAVLAGMADLRAQAALLRTAEGEPAHVFRLSPMGL